MRWPKNANSDINTDPPKATEQTITTSHIRKCFSDHPGLDKLTSCKGGISDGATAIATVAVPSAWPHPAQFADCASLAWPQYEQIFTGLSLPHNLPFSVSRCKVTRFVEALKACKPADLCYRLSDCACLLAKFHEFR